MTPEEVKQARKTLGLTAVQFAAVLRYSVASDQTARNRTSEIETGSKLLDAPRAELLRAYLSGYRAADWPA